MLAAVLAVVQGPGRVVAAEGVVGGGREAVEAVAGGGLLEVLLVHGVHRADRQRGGDAGALEQLRGLLRRGHGEGSGGGGRRREVGRLELCHGGGGERGLGTAGSSRSSSLHCHYQWHTDQYSAPALTTTSTVAGRHQPITARPPALPDQSPRAAGGAAGHSAAPRATRRSRAPRARY